jgi:hypothetical protein
MKFSKERLAALVPLLGLGFCISQPVMADAPPVEWENTFGGSNHDTGFSVQQTPDGGYIISGQTESYGEGDFDVYLIKTDPAGNELWDQTYGGSGRDDGYSVDQTTDGGYIVVGRTTSCGAGNYDVYLIKTDADGNQLWQKTFGGSGRDEGYTVQQTSDGGYIITGGTFSFGLGHSDVYLIKTDSYGNQEWYQTYGASSDDDGQSVQQTHDGGYIIAGYTSSFGAGDYDVYLIKTDSAGNELWHKTFGGIADDLCYSIDQTTDGGYILSGRTQSFGAGGVDVYLIKTDSSGNPQWEKTFGGSGTDWGGHSVQQTTDGGYITTGRTDSFGAGSYDVYLIKTDFAGNLQWQETFGGTGAEYAFGLLETADGGIIITGQTESLGAGHFDAYLVKLGQEPPDDTDGDGVMDNVDNCPLIANPDQTDTDEDGQGDVCDEDDDNDGLTDDDEILCGTNPNVQDTDGDGLLDGTEFDTAGGCGGCPDPGNFDSDGDELSDGAEVDLPCGPDPCDPDSDGDGVLDGTDPTPCDAGVPPDFLEELALNLCAQIQALDLGLFNGPNNNANKGRRNSLANRACNAAKKIANGDFANAIDKLESLLAKIDGESPPPDWMNASAERDALVVDVALLNALLLLE